jgi:hypothetical protein
LISRNQEDQTLKMLKNIAAIAFSATTVFGADAPCEPFPGKLNAGTLDTDCCSMNTAVVVYNVMTSPTYEPYRALVPQCMTASCVEGTFIPSDAVFGGAMQTLCTPSTGATCQSAWFAGLSDTNNVGAMNPLIVQGMDMEAACATFAAKVAAAQAAAAAAAAATSTTTAAATTAAPAVMPDSSDAYLARGLSVGLMAAIMAMYGGNF